MLSLLSLLILSAPVAHAAEIEVSGVTVQVLRVDGQRLSLPPGSRVYRRKGLDAGAHAVVVETPLGKVITSFEVELGLEEGARLEYRKKKLAEVTRYPVDPPREGGLLNLSLAGGGTSSERDLEAVTLEKKGMLRNWVWIDGAEQGRLTNRRAMSLPVAAGPHEVWVSASEDGVWTWCHGLVEQGGLVEVTMGGCSGLTPGLPAEGSFYRGATVVFAQTPEVMGAVSIDSGPTFTPGASRYELNLSPGSHVFALYGDPLRATTYAQGTFTAQGGAVTCSSLGCVGLDQPPVPFTPVSQRTTGAPAAASGGGGGGEGGDYCCVNDAFYACPTASAAYDCTGAFMACLGGCDLFTDPSCMETCSESHPIDPSGCERASSRDGQCH